MPRYLDTMVVLPEPTNAAGILTNLNGWLKARGILFAPDANVIFHDFENKEKEPEIASSEDDAISRILAWPGLGGTEYLLAGHRISVFLYGVKAYHADVITFSMNATAYGSNAAVQDAHKQFVAEIHTFLKAKRTIADFELLSPGSWLMQEVDRVRNEKFEGRYAVDLR
jgi:hypothetical protein